MSTLQNAANRGKPLGLLETLRARVKPEIQVSVESAEAWEEKLWHASISTPRNEWPHWFRFEGDTPANAIKGVLAFLDGKEPDHCSNPRPPAAFLCGGGIGKGGAA